MGDMKKYICRAEYAFDTSPNRLTCTAAKDGDAYAVEYTDGKEERIEAGEFEARWRLAPDKKEAEPSA